VERISIFIPSLERGGVERNIVYLAKGLSAQGYGVDLLVAFVADPFLKEIPSSVRIIHLNPPNILPGFFGFIPYRVRLATSVLPKFLFYLRRERPKVLISFQSSVLAVWARELAGLDIRLIVRESNTPSEATSQDKHWFGRIVPYLKRWSYPRADAVVAVSEGVADDLVYSIGIPRKCINVIYNPVYDDTILEKAKEPLNHPWFKEGEPPVILGVGRLTRQKDFGTLLRAFALVRKEFPARLVILGEGEERAKLETLARQLRISKDVDMPGFVGNPYKYLSRAGIFVLSSRYEGLPNSLIEAMALKIPVVSTDCPSGPKEILLDGAAGPLVPVEDPKALGKEILILLGNKELVARYIREGQKYIGRFRPEAVMKQYLKLLDVDSG